MKRLIIVIIAMAVLMTLAQGSYAGMDDRSDRMSNEQSNVFSPGYINAAKQRTEAIINQKNQFVSLIEKSTESVKKRLSGDVIEDNANRVTPERKKKTGSLGLANNGMQAKTQTVVSYESRIVNSGEYNADIGSGTDKVYQGNRLVSEIIGNARHIYVGDFEKNGVIAGVSQIQEAIDLAQNGDIVIVRGGDKAQYNSAQILAKSVKLYGGYSADGTRDIVNTPSIVNGIVAGATYSNRLTGENRSYSDAPIEINGFTVTGDLLVTGLSNVTLINNDYHSQVVVFGSTALIKNNIFSSGAQLLVSKGTGVAIDNNEFKGYSQLTASETTAMVKNNVFEQGGIVTGWDTQISSSNNNYFGSFAGLLISMMSGINSANDYYAGSFVESPTILNQLLSPIQSADREDTKLLMRTSFSSSVSTASSVLAMNVIQNMPYYGGAFDSYNSQTVFSQLSIAKTLNSDSVGGIFKSLLANKTSLSPAGLGSGQINAEDVEMVVKNAFKENTSLGPSGMVNAEAIDAVTRLANIINDPTADQKEMLDTLESMLNDVENAERDKAQSPELKKASDDLLQAVAAALLVQAIPNLLKEGDISGIKNIFHDLNASKEKALSEYNELVKPYYDKVKELLSKNMATLQISNMIPKQMVEEELSKLEPNEVDKLLEKLRKVSKRSFEEDYILQQEAKHRREYLDPNKKILEDKMKDMMKDFTRRLYGVLEEKGISGK